jgi:hypothetical protein
MKKTILKFSGIAAVAVLALVSCDNDNRGDTEERNRYHTTGNNNDRNSGYDNGAAADHGTTGASTSGTTGVSDRTNDSDSVKNHTTHRHGATTKK